MTTLSREAAVVSAYQLVRGSAASNGTYNALINVYNTGGEPNLATVITQNTAGLSNDALANTVVTNAGLAGRPDVVQYVSALFAAFGPAARGQVILNLAERLSNFTNDVNFGQTAAGFNAVVASNTLFSQSTTSTSDRQSGGGTLSGDTDNLVANVFTAGLVTVPGVGRVNSLQDEDVLVGQGANPTLNATLGNANDNGGTIITPSLRGVETLNVAFTGSSNTPSANNAVQALDLQDATGVKAVNLTRVSQAVDTAEVGNITTTASTLSLASTNANQAGVVEYSYASNVLKGVNSGDFTVNNVQVGTINIGQNTSGIAGRGVGINGFENLALHSQGSAENTIGILNLPADTGTTGKITIDGSAALTLATNSNITQVTGGPAEAVLFGGGVLQAQGRLQTIDASALTGGLKINVGNNILSAGKADTSGVAQDVSIIGSKVADTFYLNDVVGAGDVLDGGEGDDSLVVFSGGILASGGTVKSIENVAVTATAAVTLDFDKLADTKGVSVRNISNVTVLGTTLSTDNNLAVTLNNLTVAQAAAITVAHGVTNNNSIDDLTVVAALKADTASDTVAVKIVDGTNIDPRFNFTLSAAKVENVSIADSDTESNIVLLANSAAQTGTVTLTGGQAGKFVSLDASNKYLAGGVLVDNDVATNTKAGTAATGVQQGLLGLGTQDAQDAGLATITAGPLDAATGHYFEAADPANAAAVAAVVRLGAATIDASAHVGNVIVRVGTNAASAVGAQKITTGTGNDVVIFDLQNDTRAGLTISDTVDGGAGADQLWIDGQGVRINLAASEWTNVKNFETLGLVGNGVAAAQADVRYGDNSYNLTLTNDLIVNNGAGLLKIVNDNDASNDVATTTIEASVASATAGTAVERGVTIDARQLTAQNHFSYNGEEGVSGALGGTVDRFILADANLNGGNIIDGGANDNLTTTFAGNGDILEIRNAAQATAGDLANLKNIGIFAASNDTAVEQRVLLELNDSIVDALVDSFHASKSSEREILQVRAGSTADVVAPVAATTLDLDVRGLTVATGANVVLDTTKGGIDNIQLGLGSAGVTINGFAAQDEIVLSKALFTAVTAAAGATALNAGDFTAAAAVNSATDVSASAIVYNTTSGELFYNTDGVAAGGLILVGVLAAAPTLTVANFTVTN